MNIDSYNKLIKIITTDGDIVGDTMDEAFEILFKLDLSIIKEKDIYELDKFLSAILTHPNIDSSTYKKISPILDYIRELSVNG